MFDNLTLKGKLLVLESISFVMFLAMAIFGLLQLNGAVQDEKVIISRLHNNIEAMNEISTMNIAFLKEVKLAKDVWIRGADPEKLKKLRGEFVEQQTLFDENRTSAMTILKKQAEGHPEYEAFINKLNLLGDEHKATSGKYLAQIDAHKGNVAESDAAVAGIDRELSSNMIEQRDSFAKFVTERSAQKIVVAEEDFQQRRNIVLIWTMVSLGLSIFLAAVIVRSLLLQLGGDPKDVAQVVNNYGVR